MTMTMTTTEVPEDTPKPAKVYEIKRIEGRVRTKYIFLHPAPYNEGAMTIAYRPRKDGYLVGLAFSSPDDTFCKKAGRKVAARRLYSNPLEITGKGDVANLVLQGLQRGFGKAHPSRSPFVVGHRNKYTQLFISWTSHGSIHYTIQTKTLHARRPFLGASWLGRVKPWTADLVELLIG